jgi:inhibitor of KinA sporulation pathway (predicted exonuclease)
VKLTDFINVIDVESTCWSDRAPEGEVSEIIEVGISVLEVATLNVVDGWEWLITPTRSTVSPFCSELTGIEPADLVVHGVDFNSVCQQLRAGFSSKDRIWASWGDYDRGMFERQCRDMEVPYPFGSRHLNIKSLAALAFGWEKELGMAEALERLELPLVGNHHRAGDDARNIAQILCVILSKVRTA